MRNWNRKTKYGHRSHNGEKNTGHKSDIYSPLPEGVSRVLILPTGRGGGGCSGGLKGQGSWTEGLQGGAPSGTDGGAGSSGGHGGAGDLGGHGGSGDSGGHGGSGDSGGHGGSASEAATSPRLSLYDRSPTIPPQKKSSGELMGLNSGTGALPGLNGGSEALPGLNGGSGALPGLNWGHSGWHSGGAGNWGRSGAGAHSVLLRNLLFWAEEREITIGLDRGVAGGLE